MAYSTVVIPGDGATTLVTVNFALGQIAKEHVSCYVTGELDGSGNQLYRSFSFLNGTSAQVDGTPCPVGESYVFSRVVPKDVLLVDYEDGDGLTSVNLDKMQKQAIMMVHEVLDGIERSIKVEPGGVGYSVAAGIPEGATLAIGAQNTIVEGPTVTEVSNAEEYAEDALAAKLAAISAKDFAEAYMARAEEAALSVENPVGYAPQSRTEAEKKIARNNIGASITSNMSITVGPGGDYPTLQAAYSSVDRFIAPGVKVTITILGHLTKSISGYHLFADHPQGTQILIRGITPIVANILSVDSVTGVPGDWSVTVNVDNAAGIEVNDFGRVTDVVPGYKSIYTYSGPPQVGELYMPRVSLGKLSTVGTVGTVSLPNLSTYMPVGALLLMKGECRRVSSIDSATQFTMVTGGLTVDIATDPRLNWWFMGRPVGGGCSVAGTALTGIGTTYLTQFNPGDYALIQNGTIVRVTAIASNLAMTLMKGLGTIPSTKWVAPITRGHHHEGGWRITAVVGNKVTWKNTSRSAYAPPKHLVTGGKLTVLKSSIQDTGAGSGILCATYVDIDDLAIVGDLGTGTYGVNLGRLLGSGAESKLGPNTIILGYDNGLYGDGSFAEISEVAICGTRETGVYARDGSNYKALNSVVNGCGAKGFVVYGGYANLTGARALGNGDDGLWVRTGEALAESFVSEDNLRGGIWVVGGGTCDAVQARIMGNAYGIAWEHGGSGCRYPGALIVGNTVMGVYALQAGVSHLEDANICTNGIGVYTESLSMLNLSQAGYAHNTTNRSVSAKSFVDETLVLQTP